MPNPPQGWVTPALPPGARLPPPGQQHGAAGSDGQQLPQAAQQEHIQMQQQDLPQGQQPHPQDEQQPEEQDQTWWELQQQEEGVACHDEPKYTYATWAAGVQQEAIGQGAQHLEGVDAGADPFAPAQRPLFFARFTAGWLYASMGTVAASILEKRRDYAAAVDLLRLLLGGNACPARRGAWWTRLSINLEHMKVRLHGGLGLTQTRCSP
jgi:hypothetical protein